MARQYFYLVVCNYDECTYPEKIFLQELDAITWGRRQATKTLEETKDYNYIYVLYKQEITKTGVIDLKNGKTLKPYPSKKLENMGLVKKPVVPEKALEEFDWGQYKDIPMGSDYDIDKERA